MSTVKLALSIVEVIVCVFLTVVVLLEQGFTYQSGNVRHHRRRCGYLFWSIQGQQHAAYIVPSDHSRGVIFVVLAVVMNCI